MTRTPGLESSGGLLGMGLSVAQGMAFADRIVGRDGRVFCILGDGELQEGNIWEAAMSAGHYQLEHPIAIVDANAIMSKGRLDDYLTVEPLADKWRAFGWTRAGDRRTRPRRGRRGPGRGTYREHQPAQRHPRPDDQGQGSGGFENSHRWHTHAPDPRTADELLRGLARMYGRPERGYTRIDLPVNKEVFRV